MCIILKCKDEIKDLAQVLDFLGTTQTGEQLKNVNLIVDENFSIIERWRRPVMTKGYIALIFA